jgi:hypothetical protein
VEPPGQAGSLPSSQEKEPCSLTGVVPSAHVASAPLLVSKVSPGRDGVEVQ